MSTRAIMRLFGRRFYWVLAAVFALLGAGAAVAADPAYLAEYKLYNQALEQGDMEGAAVHARAAWQVAEDALGDHETTAVLAYNYGRLVLFNDTENALKALRRANELQEAGFGELPQAELQLFLAFAEFEVGGRKRRQAINLRKALEQIDSDGANASADIASMWLRLASSELQDNRYGAAEKSAAKAEATINAALPNDYRGKAEAILIGAVARLIPFPRSAKDVEIAHIAFRRALRLFPPQKDRESFDPILADIIAWNAAAKAALYSKGISDYRVHNDPDDPHNAPSPPLFEGPLKPEEGCNGEWKNRPPPEYPTRALNKGYIGAVIVIYDLSDELTVQNAEILAEVPVETFGEIVLSSMTRWRMKSAPLDHPACWTNLLTEFTFVIEG